MQRLDLPAVTRLGRGNSLTLLSVILLRLPTKFLRLLLTPLLRVLVLSVDAMLTMYLIISNLVVLELSLLWLTRVAGTATWLELGIDTFALMPLVSVRSEEWSEVTPSPVMSVFYVRVSNPLIHILDQMETADPLKGMVVLFLSHLN